MLVEISIGEYFDKLSILEIKLLRIQDKYKLQNVQREFYSLNEKCSKLFDLYGEELQSLYLALSKVNQKLWDIEDAIRDKERNKSFDEEFVELARSVYFTNDKRARIKNDINLLTGSELVEEKSYTDYK